MTALQALRTFNASSSAKMQLTACDPAGCKKQGGFSLWNQRPCIFILGESDDLKKGYMFSMVFSNIIFVFIISEPFGTSVGQPTAELQPPRANNQPTDDSHQVFRVAFESGIIFEDQAKVKILRRMMSFPRSSPGSCWVVPNGGNL